MEKNKVRIEKTAEVIIQVLKDTREVTFDVLKKATDKTASETVKAIKGKAPVRKGAYAKGWTSKKTTESPVAYGKVVHNRNRYQLAHLLEHGHDIKGYLAKRTAKTRTRAFPHIPSEEETEAKFMKYLEEEVEKE